MDEPVWGLLTAAFSSGGYRDLMVDDNAVCYRHDDRRAAVGCQRCDRPICSQCMTAASVGFHCPECTKSGAQKVYRPGDLISKPMLVHGIIAVCAVVFVCQLLTGEGRVRSLDEGVTQYGLLFGPFVEDGELWRIITSAFLHGSFIHIAVNMYALYSFGPEVQRAVGTAKAALIYAGGLFGGSAAVLAFDFTAPTLGASGAVLGLAGGLTGILFARGANITRTPLFGVMMFNLALPLFVPLISFWGHFGGTLGGFLVGASMAKAHDSRAPSALVGGGGPSASVVGGLVVLALAVAAVAASFFGSSLSG